MTELDVNYKLLYLNAQGYEKQWCKTALQLTNGKIFFSSHGTYQHDATDNIIDNGIFIRLFRRLG